MSNRELALELLKDSMMYNGISDEEILAELDKMTDGEITAWIEEE